RVSSIRAVVPPTPELPEWLGKRPPVPGEWTQTLAEDFDRAALDETHWSIYYPNYWDKRAHFSKDNVLLGDGLLRLRFEKKRGHAEDNATKPETDWQTGFLTSVGKWRQRYGYFECRLKLPTAPGLWPAFWMMPDRGDEAGNQRESTSSGGMEFDVLEYLTRYGPYRYNIAWHWDGYGKDHKSIGTERIYVQPDREGFITAGLLWEPGRLTFYANGTALAQWIDARVASVPEYILFTAVSGGWGGNDLTGEGLPDDFVLDYVRAWQRSDWAAETPK
ncbi:glycoside hydrolase family 16 protein, partial [bacterium]|nr:glycoside hydrolase family 16 protein [bacterium]